MPRITELPAFTQCLFAVALGLWITAMGGVAGAREPDSNLLLQL